MNAVRSLITKLIFKSDRRGLNSYNSSVERLKVNMDSLKYKAMAFGAVMAGVGGYSLKAAGEMEQFRIAFDTMLGSAEAGSKMMKDLRELTLKTPFSFQQSALGAKRLMAFGISAEKVIPALKNLGNIASGVGMHKLKEIITAYGQIKTARFLRGQEIRQLTESGIPIIEELADMLGKTPDQITKMSRASLISFKHVEKAIHRLSNGTGRFTNLMGRQSKKLLGMFSIAKDTLYLMASDFGSKFIPTIEDLVARLGGVKEVVERIVTGFKWIISSALVLGLLKLTGILYGLGIAGLASWLKIFLPALLIAGVVTVLVGLFQSLWVTITDPDADTYLRRMYAHLAYDFPNTMIKLERFWEAIKWAISDVVDKMKELNYEFDIMNKLKKIGWKLFKLTPAGIVVSALEETGVINPIEVGNKPVTDSGSQSLVIENMNFYNDYMTPNDGDAYSQGYSMGEGVSDALQKRNQKQSFNEELLIRKR